LKNVPYLPVIVLNRMEINQKSKNRLEWIRNKYKHNCRLWKKRAKSTIVVIKRYTKPYAKPARMNALAN